MESSCWHRLLSRHFARRTLAERRVEVTDKADGDRTFLSALTKIKIDMQISSKYGHLSSLNWAAW